MTSWQIGSGSGASRGVQRYNLQLSPVSENSSGGVGPSGLGPSSNF